MPFQPGQSGNPDGRATDYNDQMPEKVRTYIKECEDVFVEGKVKVNLPTMAGLANYLGVTKQTLYNWQDKHLLFFDSMKELLQKQEKVLLDNGLAGTYNSTIAKLILSNNHGYRERSDVTSDNQKITPIYNGLSVNNND